MNGMKGGALLLLLGIPFALYAAWQVNGATHIGTGAPEAPADKTATKEQLDASSAKATAWSGESRKAVAVTWQYRKAGPDASSDATVAPVVNAAEARSADLNDLDTFLSSVKQPVFTGTPRLKLRYTEWASERVALDKDEREITDWFSRPPQIATAADADKEMVAFIKLVDQYVARSQFADKVKATNWRCRARLAVIEALTALATSQYRIATSVKLPLKAGTNEGTAAVATLGALKIQIASLGVDVTQADIDKVAFDASFRIASETKSGNASEYTAREELLTLFAQPKLFDNASGATQWLKLVASQYAKTTKNPEVQALIRDKVQEFADAFVPAVARLDDDVILLGRATPRDKVVFEFEVQAGDGVMKKNLSANPNEFNEFVLKSKPPGVNHVISSVGNKYVLDDLKPTPLSNAAVAYNAARAKLANRPAPSRWTADSVAELKKACEGQKELVDQLRTLDSGPKDEAKIATRVAGLVAGM